ncbi:hypothetical protein COLO4_09280 [Corchorus olitorius]|uniref:Uncharacterized protein n=1 Tax=Corchorus olitorius TaxID=93759 RepID=A0A1R3KCJ4_9ROSI|nr:hypothetical protein COLO4_09280 [Corchorus olitorius]
MGEKFELIIYVCGGIAWGGWYLVVQKKSLKLAFPSGGRLVLGSAEEELETDISKWVYESAIGVPQGFISGLCLRQVITRCQTAFYFSYPLLISPISLPSDYCKFV